jgi:protein-L-isoaspartate(D-aspartate) O-methyltransferase
MTLDREKAALLKSLRKQGIKDARVLDAMAAIPREAFMERVFAAQSYADAALPIACGQTISQPYVVALMTEALMLEPHHRVLEIGTGSGYQAAILSVLAAAVFTVERYASLSKSAQMLFKGLGLANIACHIGDGHAGWLAKAPFDRIIVTAAAAKLPDELISQLAPDGILVIPLAASAGRQDIHRFAKTAQGLAKEHLLPARFVPLVAGVPHRG